MTESLEYTALIVYISENHTDGIIGKVVACQLFCCCIAFTIQQRKSPISLPLIPKHQSQVYQADSDPELWCKEPFTC